MTRLPPPDPNEYQEPEGLVLDEPAAIYLAGPPSADVDRTAAALLAWRPGALVVAVRD
jgi:hypothetical protein